MQNQYYLKDKKAQLYKKIEEGEPGLAPKYKYYPIAPDPIWCYTRQMSQNDIYLARSHGDNETRLFVFNYHANIEVYDMVLYRGEWYRITRVDTMDDYKGEMFIYVQNAIGGWIPSDGDIKGYTPGKWQ